MLGPTAAGKSAIAEQLARRIGAVIVSVDSMQVYRGMDIGTAKALPDVRQRIPHFMIDIADPEHDYSVAEYQEAATRVVDRTLEKGVPVIVSGGSGLHFRSIVDPLSFPETDPETRGALEAAAPADLVSELLDADPAAGAHVDLANPRRVLRAVEIHRLTGETPTQRAADPRAVAVRSYEPVRPFTAVGVDPGGILAGRVADRFDTMLDAGLVAEVHALEGRWGTTASQAVGYKQLLPVVRGERSLGAGRDLAVTATVGLAKRQRTFFRRDPRIHWLKWHHDLDARVDAAHAALGAD